MAVQKDDITEALRTVNDPDLKKDLVTLDMIKDIEVDGNKVSFTVVLTTPACPLKEKIKADCIHAVKAAVSDTTEITVNMTSNVTSARSGNTPLLPGVKNIIAVASGKGGVGKSTVTANLAAALAKSGATVGLVDADIFGPSIPTMFGVESERPMMVKKEEKNMMVPVEKHGVKLISIGFVAPPDAAVVWRGPMASSALKQLIGDTDWGKLDYLLIDLPPGTSDIHLTLVQSVPVTGAVIVTTPQKVALADAVKGLAMFQKPQINVPVLGVVENMAYFTPEELPENKYFIFGKEGGKALCEKFDVPYLGEIPLVQHIRESGDEGRPAVLSNDITAKAFEKLAESVAQQTAVRNAEIKETKKVEIKN